ncbi:Ig domain-containing protein [Vibrio campbellii]|nr:Ig domain-containing protein [Vibrio campbellii]
MTNNNNVTEVYNVRNIAWTASNVNKLLATLAVSSLLSGCGGGGDSDSTPAAKPPIENKKDEIPPVITLVGSKSITVYLNDKFEDPGFTATDNVDGDISKRVKVSYDKPIDTDTVGTYTITYTVTDKAGNKAVVSREVKVESKAIPAPDVESDKDTEKPQITLKGGEEIIVYLNDEFQDPGFTATDNVDGDISNRVQVSYDKPIDTDTVGTYTITYKVTDKAGNKATASRKVTVKSKAVADTEKPQITLKGGEEITVYLNDEFQDPGFTATDNVDGDISKRVQVSGKPDTGTVGTYTLTYKVTDTAGNEATAKRVVEVVEGIVFRDSDIVLYENEYQHRIWYDVKSDNIDASKITFELSEQSTATVDKAQGQTLDVELVEVKNSTSKSGYFTLAIHDDEEFEGKERIVVNVLSDKAFVKELNIDLDDTDSKGLVEHGALTAIGQVPYYRRVVLDDMLYAFDGLKIAKYDLINQSRVKYLDLTHWSIKFDIQPYWPQVVIYQDEIYWLNENKLYQVDKNDLTPRLVSLVPAHFQHGSRPNQKILAILGNKLYVFDNGLDDESFLLHGHGYHSYDFETGEWLGLPDFPDEGVYGKHWAMSVSGTKVVGDDIYILEEKYFSVFNTKEWTWSQVGTGYKGKSAVEATLSHRAHFSGSFAYDFLNRDKVKYFTRYEFDADMKVTSVDERVIPYFDYDPIMYKGRLYMTDGKSTDLSSIYWGDNH